MKTMTQRLAVSVLCMLLTLVPMRASAQQRQPSPFLHLARTEPLASTRVPHTGLFARTPVPDGDTRFQGSGEGARSPWRLPLIGAGVGAGLGTLVVFVGCEQGSCFSENTGVIVGGAALGAATGAAIELVRRVF